MGLGDKMAADPTDRGPTRSCDVLASFLQGEILSVGRVRAGNELRIGRNGRGTKGGAYVGRAPKQESCDFAARARRIVFPHLLEADTATAELTDGSDERSSTVSFNREDCRTEGAVGLRLRPTTCSLP